MSIEMGRRQWLRSSAIAAGAWALARERVYSAGVPGETNTTTIYLDQNENPYGISKKAEMAIVDAIKVANRYPGDETAELRDLIAEREGVPKTHVILGAGSTEIFSLAGLLWGAEGKEVLLSEPTYIGFKNYVQKLKGKLNLVPVNDRWECDLDETMRRLTGNVSLVYVCNPNNPTGTVVDGGKLRAFCEEMARRTMVFVDEAYHDLVEDPRHASMMDLARKGANVMVARTFSKIHGLAGMRIGYGIAKPEIIEPFRRIQTNFAPLSQLSIAAAKASYTDTDYLTFCRQRNAEARSGLYALLDKLGYKTIKDSQANFIIFQIDGKPEVFVEEFRKKHNILLRPFTFLEKNWVRISMGTRDEMGKLAIALQGLS
jgi:histidinol-phosphate aminotransferase